MLISMDSVKRASDERALLTLREAVVLADLEEDQLRKDIEKKVVTPREQVAAGPEKHYFDWTDLVALTAIYQPVAPFFKTASYRRMFISQWRDAIATSTDAMASQSDAQNTLFISCFSGDRSHLATSHWSAAKAVIMKFVEVSSAGVINSAGVVSSSRDVISARIAGHGAPDLFWQRPSDYGDTWICQCKNFDHRNMYVAMGNNVVIDVKSAVDEIDPKAQIYERGLGRIETRDDVLGGEPVFRDSRLPVRHIGAIYDKGEALDEILRDYPYLAPEDIEFARLYYKAHPPKGRPSLKKKGSDDASAAG